MPRRYENSKSAPSRKEEAYTKALAKLRTLQDEAEQPENRYICPCISAASSKEDTEYMAKTYKRFLHHLYPDGPNNPPRPIDPKYVTPNEILLRMLAQEDTTPSEILASGDFSHVKEELTDGYVRWDPPSTPPRRGAALDKLTKRIGRTIARLESRRDAGYGSTATPCDPCPAGMPENKIPQTGIMAVTSYMCEMARAQTPEDIAVSNANLDTIDQARADVWTLKAAD